MLERNAMRQADHAAVTISFIMENRKWNIDGGATRFSIWNGKSSGATVDVPFSIWDEKWKIKFEALDFDFRYSI